MGLIGPVTEEILECDRIIEENIVKIEKLNFINAAIMEKKVKAVQKIVYPQFNWLAIRKYIQGGSEYEQDYIEFMKTFMLLFRENVKVMDIKPVGMAPCGYAILFSYKSLTFYLFYPDTKKASAQNIDEMANGKLELWLVTEQLQAIECLVSSYEFMDILKGFNEFLEPVLV